MPFAPLDPVIVTCAREIFVKKIKPIIIAFQQFLIVGLSCLLLAFFTNSNLEIPTINSGLIIVYLAIIPTLSALVIQFVAQKYLSEVKTGIILSLEPVFAAIFSWTIGGETFSFYKLLGGLLIVLAMVISEIKFKKFKTV